MVAVVVVVVVREDVVAMDVGVVGVVALGRLEEPWVEREVGDGWVERGERERFFEVEFVKVLLVGCPWEDAFVLDVDLGRLMAG